MSKRQSSGIVPSRRNWLWVAGIGAVVALIGAVAQRAAHGPVRGAEAVSELYDRLAPAYDIPAWIFEFFGARGMRRQAVGLLGVQRGDTVVDLGCGSGFNLVALSEVVGPTGRVIGVDLSAGMLRRARTRADRHDLQRVTLVHSDMRDYSLPSGTTAVLATFSLEMVPEHDAILTALAEQLAPVNGRTAVLGVRRPESWPAWAASAGRLATAVFGVTSAYENIQPWHSVRRHFEQVHFQTAAAGAIYLAVGRAGSGGRERRNH